MGRWGGVTWCISVSYFLMVEKASWRKWFLQKSKLGRNAVHIVETLSYSLSSVVLPKKTALSIRVNFLPQEATNLLIKQTKHPFKRENLLFCPKNPPKSQFEILTPPKASALAHRGFKFGERHVALPWLSAAPGGGTASGGGDRAERGPV